MLVQRKRDLFQNYVFQNAPLIGKIVVAVAVAAVVFYATVAMLKMVAMLFEDTAVAELDLETAAESAAANIERDYTVCQLTP